jgi:Na+/H+ antiporter NhaA
MKIGGHSLREYLRCLLPSLALIGAVFVLRLVLELASAPPPFVRAFSVTAASAVAILLAVVLMHARRFGGYSSVFVAAFILVLWEEVLIVLAIAFATLTGTENVFTSPHFTHVGRSPLHHILGHITLGLGFGTLAGGATGCVLLWLLRKMVPMKTEPT